MTPSAHDNFTMAKSIATKPNHTINPTQPPDHSKTTAATNVPTPSDSIDLNKKLQPNTDINAMTTLNDDETMTPSEDQPDDESITPTNDNLTKPNPYNSDMRDRMIKHATEIKFVKDRYTTPIIVEFGSPLKSGNNTINIASIHCQIFTAMKLLDSSLKIITQDGRIIEHPKDFPTGNEYKKHFPNTTEELDRFKSKKIFTRHKIESSLKLNQFKHGDENIMATLRDSWAWIRSDKFDTHREASIGWLKNMSTITTLHNTARSKVEQALLDVTLTAAEVRQFTPTQTHNKDDDEATLHDNNKKKQRSNSGNATHKNDFDIDDYSPLILPAFDLSSSTVSYGNGKLRVKTTAFEVKCHPDQAKILKTLLIRSSLNTDTNNYDNIQFVPYGLAQVAGEQVYKQQIVKQNVFLHNLAIIPVHNIDADIMYGEIIPKSRKIGSIKGFEPTFLTDTRGKWLLVTTKAMKSRAQASFDEILTDCSIPMNTSNPPGRVSQANNNTDMISYSEMLKKDTTPYDLNKNLPPKTSLKRNFTVSYDINANNEFPNIPNTPKKSKQKPNTRTRESMGNNTTTTSTVSNNNEGDISTLLDENNKTEQANVTKQISENNEHNKITFRQMLEDNHKKIKLDIMETLQTTLDENNKSLLNKIDTKMETMFLEFQTYMMKSTNDLVQSLQANQQNPNNNAARLSQVYDEATNSIAPPNTNNNNSTPEYRQNPFPNCLNPYHPSQMITQPSQFPPYNMVQVPATRQNTIQQITPAS